MTRKLLLILGCLFLLTAANAAAQCVDCRANSQGCLYCHDTTYNAAGLCRLVYNGAVCETYGDCTGWSGGNPCQTGEGQCIPFDQTTSAKPWLTNQWKLASVHVARKERRRT